MLCAIGHVVGVNGALEMKSMNYELCDFSATAGASEPASATPNSVVSDDSNGDDVTCQATPTTSLTSQFNDDDEVIGEYRVANEPMSELKNR